jgi:DNA-binding HxlR family transcriptional regulator
MRCIAVESDKFSCEGCPERISVDVDRCPAHRIFHHIGDKWTLPILGTLYSGPLRFSQFRKMLPSLSERMLILTLNKLERYSFILRDTADDAPLQNAYRLAPLGRSLLEHISDMHLWMDENAAAVLSAFKAAEAEQGKVIPESKN